MKTLAFRFAFLTIVWLTLLSMNGNAQLWVQSEPTETAVDYVFETIKVPGVEFLELISTNDLGHFAGNARGLDSEKMVGFTLIDGVYAAYNVPNSRTFGIYGLNNAGLAVGFYQDADEVSHGVIIQHGELEEFDFPGAAETEIFGVSESGLLIGDIFDSDGVIHGFVGNELFDVPGAMTTYADDMNADGILVGSYVDADGVYHGYARQADGSYITFNFPGMLSNLEYLFVNAINDAGIIVFRAKALNSPERTYIRHPNGTMNELKFPGSVTTVGRDIDKDGRVVGYYDAQDGRRYGFIANPFTGETAEAYSNVFLVSLAQGLNMLSVPLNPTTPMTARSLAQMVGATIVVDLDEENQRFIGWTPDAPDDGFSIEGGKGYIVNLLQPREVSFVGAAWKNQPPIVAAPSAETISGVWAFVISGHLESELNHDGYVLTVQNLDTGVTTTGDVRNGYFAAATANISRRNIAQVGDMLRITVTDTTGAIASEKFDFTVTPDALINAVLPVRLDGVGTPERTLLLQNYPNPFNPETWIPYHLSETAPVTVSIYDANGGEIRTLSLGFQSAGFYQNRSRAAYWDGRDDLGERAASGVYYYRLSTPSLHQMKRMVIAK